jgi:PAS domain S-box-containing protein
MDPIPLNPDTVNLLLSALENFSSFVVVDHNGKIIFMNENYARILGIDRQTAIGKSVEDVIPNTRLHVVIQSGREEIGEIMNFFDHSIGKEITLVCNRIPIWKNGQLIGAIGNTTIKDIDIITNLYEEIKAIKRENLQFRAKLNTLQSNLNPFGNMVGSSRAFLELKQSLLDYADSNLAILLTGETGVGKELVAKAVHNLSKRSLNNYVKINCAAIPASLLESELFGYAAGAFTGAARGGKIGKFELAHNGTLLLDEIGEMSMDLQSKLLRVLQEGEVEPVGSIRTKKVNVRLLCCTNQNLEQLVEKGSFREDFYYRINSVEIKIPPLRERLEDLEPLFKYFIQRINKENNYHILDIEDNVIRRFTSYSWPGNIRELEHVIERAAVMCRGGIFKEEHFDFFWDRMNKLKIPPAGNEKQDNLKQQIRDTEKQAIIDVLRKTNGNKTQAAKLLNIDRSRLYDRLHKYDLA